MKQRVRLFINKKEVDLDNTPSILFDYLQTDLTNPTVIKNGVSKTVSLPGTDSNCAIFGDIWDLESTTYGFNPSKKAEYLLYVDNEIVESGYMKLNSINNKKHITTFNVTLYSGLGDFFNMLSYDGNGEKLKLNNLTYLWSAETYNGVTRTYQTSSSTQELDISISKETVNEAWEKIGLTPESASYAQYRKWNYINFAPCYNATPTENFSADKVLINFSGSPLLSSITITEGDESGNTYGSYHGYSLGTIPEKIDEWAAMDLRSYLQRPVLRVKGLINAICNYARERGYNVELSPEFFNEQNHYYEDTWLTLPMLTEMELNGSTGNGVSRTLTPGSFWVYNGYNRRHQFTGSIPVNTKTVEVPVTLTVTGTNIPFETVLTSSYINGVENFSAYGVQLLALGPGGVGSTPLAASDMAWFTTKLPNGDYLKPDETFIANNIYLNKNIFPVFGSFNHVWGVKYTWDTPVTFRIDNLPSNTESFAVYVCMVANLTYDQYGASYGNRRGRIYAYSAMTATAETTYGFVRSCYNEADAMTGYFYLKTQTAGYSHARVGKSELLDTEHTPADYLISFCKMFGLYFLKVPYENTIKILTRKEFFRTSSGGSLDNVEVVNIENLIDRSDMKITPLTFDRQFYDLELETELSMNADKYKKMYSRTFGSQRLNTGYDFDTESKNIMSGNTYKGAVQSTQKSKYYLSPSIIGYNYKTPAYIFDINYKLYSGITSSSITEYDMNISVKPADLVAINPYGKYYDMYSKPQFRKEDGSSVKGENVLLFYNGKIVAENEEGDNFYYNISDDLSIMGVLNNGTPCWIYNENSYDVIRISQLPRFSRYVTEMGNAEWVIKESLDFGEPKELFVYNTVSESGSTLFNKYWDRYLTDLYSVNNRVVTAKVQLEKRPSQELMRCFYLFDNSIWVLNKIKNYSVTSYEPTECEFIKVQDMHDYV